MRYYLEHQVRMSHEENYKGMFTTVPDLRTRSRTQDGGYPHRRLFSDLNRATYSTRVYCMPVRR
jgi:hypothetical protein